MARHNVTPAELVTAAHRLNEVRDLLEAEGHVLTPDFLSGLEEQAEMYRDLLDDFHTEKLSPHTTMAAQAVSLMHEFCDTLFRELDVVRR